MKGLNGGVVNWYFLARKTDVASVFPAVFRWGTTSYQHYASPVLPGPGRPAYARRCCHAPRALPPDLAAAPGRPEWRDQWATGVNRLLTAAGRQAPAEKNSSAQPPQLNSKGLSRLVGKTPTVASGKVGNLTGISIFCGFRSNSFPLESRSFGHLLHSPFYDTHGSHSRNSAW